jgi:phospholipid N-methyltransferase
MSAVEMSQPFDSIESAHDFMNLLAEAILEAAKELNQDQQRARLNGHRRRVDAVDLALFKLKMLNCHIHKSRRILNDLRMIRRLMFDERLTVERALASM